MTISSDGVFRLEQKLGLSKADLEALNPSLDSTGLMVGMVLKIPKAQAFLWETCLLVQNLFLGKCKFCWSRRGWLLLFFVSTTQNGSRCIGTLFYPHSLFKVWKRFILSRHLYYFYCHVHKVAAKNETRIFSLQKQKKRLVSNFQKFSQKIHRLCGAVSLNSFKVNI